MPSPNYFSHESAAERYAKYRPYFHPLAIGHLTRFTGCARFARVLDVGCGTGNSTRALAEIADHVTAIDLSPAMLAHVPALPNVVYQIASAEALPFADGSFDLLTVFMAFHWFDQDRFLAEARRVLQPGGWLLIYSNIFLGGMKENPAFKPWVNEAYMARYSTPPRSLKKITAERMAGFGFTLAGRENFYNDVPMTCEQLVGYFLTQSNTISAIEHGREKLADVAAWLDASIRPFFTQPTVTLQFGSDINYLRKHP